MSVYYQYGISLSGDSTGLKGYFYPLYVSAAEASAAGTNGKYHTHTFAGLTDHTFYMPMSSAQVHGGSVVPLGGFNGETYQEHTSFTIISETDDISYGTPSTPNNKITIVSSAVATSAQTRQANQALINIESSRAEDLIPIQLRESADKLTRLLEDYYEYLNDDNQASNISNRIITEHDIDKTSAKYLDSIQGEIAKSIPNARTLDRVNLYKRISKYYDIRGSKESLLVFFRLFFDTTVEVFYPKEQLLKPSDGKWEPVEPTPLNEITAFSLKTGEFGLDDVQDNIFYYKNNVLLGEGQITSISKIDRVVETATDSTKILSMDAADASIYSIPAPNVSESANNQGKITTPEGYVGTFEGTLTNVDNPRPVFNTSGIIFSGADGATDQGGRILFANIGDTSSFANFNAGTIIARARPNSLTRNETIAEYWNRGAHDLVYNKHSTYPDYPGGPYFDNNARTSRSRLALDKHWSYPRGEGTSSDSGNARSYIGSDKSLLGMRVEKWGYYFGGEGTRLVNTSSKEFNTDTSSTAAIKFTKDSTATPQTGGTGKIEVSLDGETFKTIWDDSEYGNPTSFGFDNWFKTSAGANYSISGFTKLQDSGTDVLYNGHNVYTSVKSNLTNSNAVIDDPHVEANSVGFMIRFERNTLFEKSVNHNASHYDAGDDGDNVSVGGVLTSSPIYFAAGNKVDDVMYGQPIPSTGIPVVDASAVGYDETLSTNNNHGFHGSWVMYGVVSGTFTNAAAINLGDNLGNAVIRPYLRWFDIGANQVMYFKSYEGSSNNFRRAELDEVGGYSDQDHALVPYMGDRTSALLSANGYDKFGCGRGLFKNDTFTSVRLNGHRTRGPNTMKRSRPSFFDVLRDHNRTVFKGIWNRKILLPYQHGADGFGRSDISTAAFQNAWNPYHNYGGVYSRVKYTTADKKLTWCTTRDFVNFDDTYTTTGHNKGYDFKLGFQYYSTEYSGIIQSADIYNRAVSDADLSEIHNKLAYSDYEQYKIGVKITDDVSILRADTIREKSSSDYVLTNLSGQPVDGFWTYETEDFGSSINSFQIAFTGGGTQTLNWGDGSTPAVFSSNAILTHSFSLNAAENGSYSDAKGRLSDRYKIQDSNYWQDYSYEIRSGVNVNEWLNEYLKLVHPAGLKLFAALLISASRSNKWTGTQNWSAASTEAQKGNLQTWLQYLIPPSKDGFANTESGYHLPKYQPGWLTGDLQKAILFAQAMLGVDGMYPVVNSTTGQKGYRSFRQDSLALRRLVNVIIAYFIKNENTRDSIILNRYLKDQKFIDGQQHVADYRNLTSNELNENKSLIIPKHSHETNLYADLLPWSLSPNPTLGYMDVMDNTELHDAGYTRDAVSNSGAKDIAIPSIRGGAASGYATDNGSQYNPSDWTLQTFIQNGASGTATGTYTSTSSKITLTATRDSGTGNFGHYIRIRGMKENYKYKITGDLQITANTLSGYSTAALIDISDNNDIDEASQSNVISAGSTDSSPVAFSVEGTYSSRHSNNTAGTHNFIDIGVGSSGAGANSITGSITLEITNLNIQVYGQTNDPDDTTYGTHSTRRWANDGDWNESSRILQTDPFGNQNVVWRATNKDNRHNAEGGHYSPRVSVDESKTYRYSCWVKQHQLTPPTTDTENLNSRVYFGSYQFDWNTSPQIQTLLRNSHARGAPGAEVDQAAEETGSANTYFWWGDLPKVDTWYLMVGHIRANGETTAHPDSGLYDTSGKKLIDTTHYTTGGTNNGGSIRIDSMQFTDYSWSSNPFRNSRTDGNSEIKLTLGTGSGSYSVDETITQGTLLEITGIVREVHSNHIIVQTTSSDSFSTTKGAVVAAGGASYLITKVEKSRYQQIRNRSVYNNFVDANNKSLEDYVQWFGPRIDICDGDQPSVQNLIHPTIDSNTLYGVLKRPEKKAIRKFNNFSSYVSGPSENTIVIETSVADVFARLKSNYNEQLKFLDSADVGSYYNTIISDVTTLTTETITTQEDYQSSGSASSDTSGASSDSDSEVSSSYGGGGGGY